MVAFCKNRPDGEGIMASVRMLHDEMAISRRVAELAASIAGTLPKDFMVIGLLKGSFVFVADLVRALDRAGRTPSVGFMQLSSYGQSRESSGDVRLIGEVPAEVAGRSILLVDDIAETRQSLVCACDLLANAGAAEIRICVLIDKPSRRSADISVDFVGFSADDVFVVGYGIDFAERYRHLPYLGAID